jgi:hypothetical protein
LQPRIEVFPPFLHRTEPRVFTFNEAQRVEFGVRYRVDQLDVGGVIGPSEVSWLDMVSVLARHSSQLSMGHRMLHIVTLSGM